MTSSDAASDILSVLSEFPESLQQLNHLKILVTGRLGVGKTSLINFLIGKGAAPPPDLLTDERHHVVRIETKRFQKIQVTFYESPGLGDDMDDNTAVKLLRKECNDIDLVFYCRKIEEARWTPPDASALQVLTQAFGVNIWKKVILVLTRANVLQPEPDYAHPEREPTEEEKVKHFTTAVSNHLAKLREELKKPDSNPVPAEIADNVPVVAAATKRKIWLPTGEHFIAELWLTCLQRLSNRSRKELPDAEKIAKSLMKSKTLEEKTGTRPERPKPPRVLPSPRPSRETPIRQEIPFDKTNYQSMNSRDDEKHDERSGGVQGVWTECNNCRKECCIML